MHRMLSQAVLQIGEIVAVHHTRDGDAVLRAIVHPDDMQDHVLVELDILIDQQGAGGRYPACKSLIQADEPPFELGNEDFCTRVGQMPILIIFRLHPFTQIALFAPVEHRDV